MKLMLLGAPGAGKGTLAIRLAEKLSIPQISTGDIFREEAKKDHKLQQIMSSGALIPDDIVNNMVKKRLYQDDCKEGFILDGFPRTIPQAEFLENEGITFDHVINIDVKEETVIKRLGSRRTCKKCKAVYNVITQPPKQEGICDKCGGELTIREDDKEETIKNRLKAYNEKTSPLVDFYKEKGNLKNIDGNGKPQEVLDNTMKIIN